MSPKQVLLTLPKGELEPPPSCRIQSRFEPARLEGTRASRGRGSPAKGWQELWELPGPRCALTCSWALYRTPAPLAGGPRSMARAVPRLRPPWRGGSGLGTVPSSSFPCSWQVRAAGNTPRLLCRSRVQLRLPPLLLHRNKGKHCARKAAPKSPA